MEGGARAQERRVNAADARARRVERPEPSARSAPLGADRPGGVIEKCGRAH